MIFKEWLLNLNIWTLWLVDDSIKKKERSYFPPWTQLGNFGYPLWHIWCFKWNFMNCWIYYHEIWLRHSQNFRISISSNAYWHNITEQLECWIYNTPPPFVFVFLPRTEFGCGISNAESVHISFWLESLVLDPQILSAHSDVSWPFQTL